MRYWVGLLLLLLPFSARAATTAISRSTQPVSQDGAWNVGQSGSFTVTPGTGTWNNTGSSVSVTNVAGTSLAVNITNIPQVSQAGSFTVTPGTGVFSVAFTSGSFSNPFYTVSTNTVISTGSITAFQGGQWVSTMALSTDRIGSGSINALNGVVVANTNGAGAVTFTLTGAWTATVSIQGFDGTNWITIGGVVPLSGLTSFLTFDQSVNVPCGGMSAVRLIATAYTSGTVLVNWDAGAAPNSIQVYNNAQGNFLDTAYQGGNWQVNVTTLPTISPGVRASTGVTVQELKDTGRQVIISSAAAITGVTTEALFTLNTSTNFTNGLTGTSFGVTPGKILRLQNFNCSFKTTGATAVGGECKLRVQSSGTCTVTSPIVAVVANDIPSGGLAGGAAGADHIVFSDGFELSGTQTFCISHIESTTASTLDVVLMGYSY